jgi:GR25 family glycosyltransferase involved in LPS biosynthesis
MDINNFFDKIYCINLDDRKDRWSQFQTEVESIGIRDVERFSAIKKTPGYLGCRDSHISIIKKAKENNYKNILIFEDDVLFKTKDTKLINQSLEQLKDIEWNLFYLGVTVTPTTKLFKQSDNLVRTTFAYTTHAYAINHTVFDKIITEAPRFNIIDVYYSNNITSMGKSFIINPMVCLQKPGYSDIENKEINYDWMVNHYNQALNYSKA